MAAQQPTHRAYAVVKREDAEDFWINIGAAFPHQDGKGFNVVVQALPIDGKIVLREPQEEPKPPPRRDRSRSKQQSSSRRR